MAINQSVLDTVNYLPEQLLEAWDETNKVNLPDNYKRTKRVLVCGMGGSALGGRVVKAFAADNALVSIDISTDYKLPGYVDRETMVIVSSYSGNTEETLSALDDALARQAPVFVITAGGKLLDMAQEKDLPCYQIDPRYNPSNQPRLAVGYSIGSIFAVLVNAGMISVTGNDIKNTIEFLKREQENLRNRGENLAGEIKDKLPVLVASEHLVGSAHIFKNQLNETSKSFSVLFDLPELNHHLMEGLKHPLSVTSQLKFIFFISSIYHERVHKRYPLTIDVVQKNNIATHEVYLNAENKLYQVFELIALGSYAQMYLGELYGEDPLAIPWVDYFKEKMA